MSGTHARPALDGWLVKVGQVIADARPASLSPSTAAPWDDRNTEQSTTLAGLEAGLEGLLSRLAFGPGRWVLMIEDDRGRYLQVLAYEDGSVLTEVVSNTYLSGDERWSEAEEERLVNLGWGLPEPPRRPNWWEAFPTVSPDIAEVSALLLTTLQVVCGLSDADSVRLAVFCSPRRGATAAYAPLGLGPRGTGRRRTGGAFGRRGLAGRNLGGRTAPTCGDGTRTALGRTGPTPRRRLGGRATPAAAVGGGAPCTASGGGRPTRAT